MSDVAPIDNSDACDLELHLLKRQLDETRRERDSMAWALVDCRMSIEGARHKSRGHFCDFRKVCDSMASKITNHLKNPDIRLHFASANDQTATAALRDTAAHWRTIATALAKELTAAISDYDHPWPDDTTQTERHRTTMLAKFQTALATYTAAIAAQTEKR